MIDQMNVIDFNKKMTDFSIGPVSKYFNTSFDQKRKKSNISSRDSDRIDL